MNTITELSPQVYDFILSLLEETTLSDDLTTNLAMAMQEHYESITENL